MRVEKVKQIIREMDENLSESDESFSGALVLISIIEVGHRIKDIVNFSSLDRKFVADFIRNLRANKFFTWNNKICHSGWFDEGGGVAFWMDVSIGLGYIQRVEG